MALDERLAALEAAAVPEPYVREGEESLPTALFSRSVAKVGARVHKRRTVQGWLAGMWSGCLGCGVTSIDKELLAFLDYVA
jgi:hypothetical protein